MNLKQDSGRLLTDLVGPVAIVAHDAGAANHIAEWLGTKRREQYFGSVRGPAKAIFSERCSWLNNFEFEDFIPKCNILISGTGWASSFEHDARKLAKDVGCHCIAVIDHWTDYRKRFNSLWKFVDRFLRIGIGTALEVIALLLTLFAFHCFFASIFSIPAHCAPPNHWGSLTCRR